MSDLFSELEDANKVIKEVSDTAFKTVVKEVTNAFEAAYILKYGIG